MYAVKMSTPFGTYTMGTYESEEKAIEHRDALKEKGRSVYIEETNGVYNGNLRIA